MNYHQPTSLLGHDLDSLGRWGRRRGIEMLVIWSLRVGVGEVIPGQVEERKSKITLGDFMAEIA